MRTFRELWAKLKGPWRRRRRARTVRTRMKDFPKLTSSYRAAFKESFHIAKLDICYIFANHWHCPQLKKYIIWFYNSIMGDRGIGAGNPVPHQSEHRDRLVELFSQMWQVSEIPDIVIHLYDLFFHKLECDVVSAWYQGLSWKMDDVTVCMTKNNIKYCLPLFGFVNIPLSWKDSPTSMTVMIDNGRTYYTIQVDQIERVHFIDGTYVLRLRGQDGYRQEILASNFWYRGPPVPTQIHGLDVTVRLKWRGPHSDFATYANADIFDLPYGIRSSG